MTPEQIAAVREALPKARYYVGLLCGHDSPGGRGMDACKPIVESVPVLLDEIAFLTERLERANADYEACVQSHQKMNAQYERATDILCDLHAASDEKGWVPPPDLWQRVHDFVESE